MELGTIPTEYVVLVSAILTGYIAYQSRINGLESARERERYLNDRMAGGSYYSDTFSFTIDSVHVHESSRIHHRIWKFLTKRFTGETTIIIRYDTVSIPGSFWTAGPGSDLIDAYWVDVEHLHTAEQTDPTIARFSIDSTSHDDIADFFAAVARAEDEMFLIRRWIATEQVS